MRCLFLVLLTLLPVWDNQGPASLGGVRPVEDHTPRPQTSEISFGTFEFHQVTFLHGGPGFFRIEGEPVRGRRYPVEAYLYGGEGIATVTFEAIDAAGGLIERLIMAREGTGAQSRFIGMMTVPAVPFRIAASGTAIDGQPFRRLDDRLFRPTDAASASPPLPPNLSAEDARMLQQMIDHAAPELIGRVEAAVAENPTGISVIPRMTISNVTYAPLVSAGRSIGLRIAYDVTFSHRAEYDPAIQVKAKYGQPDWNSLTRMEVLSSSITPTPRNAHFPYDEFTPSELRSTPLEAGAHFLFEATTYHFTADLVPDFVVHNLAKTATCIYYQRFRHSPQDQQPFMKLLESDSTVPYDVWIGRSAFKGRIPAFEGEGAFYRSFVAAGAQDCGPQPTRRF